MNGLSVKARKPIFYGHQTYDLDSLIGQSDKVTKDNGRLLAEGDVLGGGLEVQPGADRGVSQRVTGSLSADVQLWNGHCPSVDGANLKLERKGHENGTKDGQ